MFIVAALDLRHETFLVYITFIDQNSDIYPFYKAQIDFKKANNTFISVLSKYTYFVHIFSKCQVVKLLEYIKIHNYTINLIKDQ